MDKIIDFLKSRGIKHRTINCLVVPINRDSIVNYYNTDEEKAYTQLLKDISLVLGIRAFYSVRNDDYLWISILGDS